jgi:biopolymer transport protein ExbD
LIFLPARPRRSFLVLASPLACALATVAVAFVAVWGMARAARSVRVKLPKVAGGAERVDPNFGGHVITVGPGGGYLLGGTRMPRSELAARLKRLGGTAGGRREQILIRADAGASFSRVADLLEICRSAGLDSVSFEVLEESSP